MRNFAGSLAYVLAAALCLRAAFAARRARPETRHALFWLVCALVFAAFTFMRLSGFEETARSALRDLLRAKGSYGSRHGIQAPIASLAILVFAAIGVVLLRNGFRRGRNRARRAERAVFRAGLALVAMGGLIALRLISFHGTDALLYGGPVRLNWVIDIGATAVAAWSADAYRRALAREDFQPGPSARR